MKQCQWRMHAIKVFGANKATTETMTKA
jgi:hypothetical protein